MENDEAITKQAVAEFLRDLTELVRKHARKGVTNGVMMGAFEITKFRIMSRGDEIARGPDRRIGGVQ